MTPSDLELPLCDFEIKAENYIFYKLLLLVYQISYYILEMLRVLKYILEMLRVLKDQMLIL